MNHHSRKIQRLHEAQITRSLLIEGGRISVRKEKTENQAGEKPSAKPEESQK